MKPVETVTQV